MSNYYKKNKPKKNKHNYPFHCNALKCDEKIILLLTKNKKRAPVNYSSLSEADKYELAHGAEVIFRKDDHVIHFATCTEPNRFRKRSNK